MAINKECPFSTFDMYCIQIEIFSYVIIFSKYFYTFNSPHVHSGPLLQRLGLEEGGLGLGGGGGRHRQTHLVNGGSLHGYCFLLQKL